MNSHLPVAEALTQAARQIRIRPDLEETLTSIAVATVDSLPDIDHAGISVSPRRGTLEPRAWTADFVRDLDQLQEALSEGPAVEALSATDVVVVDDLTTDTRWANYTPQAVRYGVRAQMSLRLVFGGEVLGCLNLYSTQQTVIDPLIVPMVRLFAVHASLAVERAQREHELTDMVATRKAIGQAVGLIMERYQVDEERAYQFLVRYARGRGVNLRQVADELITGTNEKYAITAEDTSVSLERPAPQPAKRVKRASRPL